MKTGIKILILAVFLSACSGCSLEKQASRRVRRAVALCPELVQVKAHPFDTVLIAPGYADCAAISLPKVLQGDTVYAATEHGTVVVSLSGADSSLRVGFVAAPQRINYHDTIRYAQVVVQDATKVVEDEKSIFHEFVVGFVCILLGMLAALLLLLLKR